MLHKSIDIVTQSMPASSNTGLLVIVTAVTITVAESRATRSHTSWGSSVIGVYSDNCVTLWLVAWAARWNAWLDVTKTDIFMWRSCRNARVAVDHDRSGTIGDQISVAKVVFTSFQSVVAFDAVDAWQSPVRVWKVPDSERCLVQVNGGGKWVTVFNGKGIDFGVTPYRLTWSFVWVRKQVI